MFVCDTTALEVSHRWKGRYGVGRHEFVSQGRWLLPGCVAGLELFRSGADRSCDRPRRPQSSILNLLAMHASKIQYATGYIRND